MKRDGSIVSVIAISVIGLVVVLFASLREKPMIVESRALADDIIANRQPVPEEPQEYYPEINTVLVDNGRLIMGTSDGIYLKPDFADGAIERRQAGVGIMHLTTILPMGENRYVGGDGLYLLDENYSLLADQIDLGRRVYALTEFGEGILVGGDQGLWYHRDLPGDETVPQDTLLKDGIIVSAMAEDRGGLWVGAYGDGLYRFDGQKWDKRYLERDTSIFDFVTALEYTYPNLWVGTEQTLFRYDGGKWEQMFVSDSSETYNVTCMMTTPAATYIGTADGLLRYAGSTLARAAEYAGMEIVGLCRSEKGVLVATRNDGIFTYKGKEEIVSPEQLIPDLLAGDDNEILAETIPDEYTVAEPAAEYAGDTDY